MSACIRYMRGQLFHACTLSDLHLAVLGRVDWLQDGQVQGEVQGKCRENAGKGYYICLVAYPYH